mgnify:CR=1 FL=1
MELRESILEGTLKAFNQKGLKFTMDDLAGILGMSKKTIYTVFRDKESLFLAMVDYLFDSIKESERQVLENEKLSTLEKIRAVLGVLPRVTGKLISDSSICCGKSIRTSTNMWRNG